VRGVVTTTIRKSLFFWNVTPCNVMETWRRLGGICLLNVQTDAAGPSERFKVCYIAQCLSSEERVKFREMPSPNLEALALSVSRSPPRGDPSASVPLSIHCKIRLKYRVKVQR
jgi:hypothetical protein